MIHSRDDSDMENSYKSPRDFVVHRVAVPVVDDFPLCYGIHLLKHQSFLHLYFSSLNNRLESIELRQVYKNYMFNKYNNTYYQKPIIV